MTAVKHYRKGREGNLLTQTVKEKITEIIRELAFERMIERGMSDVRAGRVVSDEEMSHRIRTWQTIQR